MSFQFVILHWRRVREMILCYIGWVGGPTIRFLRYILRERHLTSRRFTRAATVNAEKAVTVALLRTRVVSHVRYLRLLRFCSRRSPAAFTRRARSAMRARQDLWSNADYRYVYIQRGPPVSLCVLVTSVSCAQTDEPIEMSTGVT